MLNAEVEMISVDELMERTLITEFPFDDSSQISLVTRYIRRLKNAVIGSNRQKENVFNHNFVPTLLSLLNNETFLITLRTEVAIIIGSLAKGKPEHIQKLIECGTVPALLEALKTPAKPFVDACLRVLRSIYQSKNAPNDEIYSDPNIVSLLLNVAHNSVCAQECVGAILMNSCDSKKCQNLLHSQNVITCFAPLLFSSVPQVKIIALGVFAAICRNNREVSEIVAYTTHMGCSILEQIRRILSHENELDVHLAAARCVTFLCRSGAMSTTDYLIEKKVMPLLVKTCKFDHNPYVKTRQRIVSCETLAHLIEEDLSLQRLTSWNNMCLQVMGQCLNSTSVERSVTDETEKANLLDDLHQAAVLVLAALASNDEDIRRKIVQESPNLLEHIMRGLFISSGMQLASLKCLHAFSRSVEQIRTVFMDKPVSRQLLQLMQSSNFEIAMSAAAIVANLVLEFSPCKSSLIECGCVAVLCDLAKSEELSARLNGIWGLMNLAYRVDDKVKSSIFRYFTPADMLRALTESPTDSPLVGRLLGLIRNLLSQKEHTDQLMAAYGTSVVQAVIFVLEGDYCAEDKEQALCILANISYGNIAKDFIMSNEDVLRKITNYIMHSSNPRFQIAAAFTVCNLVWKDDPGFLERQTRLRELGVNKLLQQLLSTKDTILFDKVKLAMQNMN